VLRRVALTGRADGAAWLEDEGIVRSFGRTLLLRVFEDMVGNLGLFGSLW
jgi:hypothetical protein